MQSYDTPQQGDRKKKTFPGGVLGELGELRGIRGDVNNKTINNIGYMKHLLYFFIPLLFFLLSCSDSSKEPEVIPPTTLETPIIASLNNPDGTYYTLHNEFIRLRKADGSIIAEHEINEPDIMVIPKPYGEQSSYRLYLNDFYTIENSVVIIYKANDADQTIPIEKGYSIAYIFSNDLSTFVEKEFTHGLKSRLFNGETVVIDSKGDLFAYDTQFEEIEHLPLPSCATQLSTLPTTKFAIGKVAGKYYVFGDIYNNMSQTEAIITNYSDGLANIVYKPYDYTIVQDFFPEESTHYPRLDSQDYAFAEDKFTVTYHYTKYSGEKVDVMYTYDVNGNQLSPQPSPERIYIETTHLSNIINSTDAPSNIDNLEDGTYVLFYPYGGSMTVAAIREISDRRINIEFDVTSSDTDILSISKAKQTRSYSSATAFNLMPKQKGNVDIIFSNSDYGIIDTWHILITEVD